MSYQKTVWKSKDIITREKMQKIEDELERLSEQDISSIAQEASAGQIPIADGNGSWAWGTIPNAQGVSF